MGVNGGTSLFSHSSCDFSGRFREEEAPCSVFSQHWLDLCVQVGDVCLALWWFVFYGGLCNNCSINKLEVSVVFCLFWLFGCAFCFLSHLSPRWLSVCSCPCSSWDLGGPLLPLFRIHDSIFFRSSCVSSSLAHIHIYIQSHTRSLPHVAISLCPVYGFVLRPQCQGPGDEVILHRRAVGLSESRPSPPPTYSAPTGSPPPILNLYLNHFRIQFCVHMMGLIGVG